MAIPPPIQLDTLSMPDTLILMVLALVVFGPRRLPMIGRQIGKLMYEFRKASNDFKFQMEEELRHAEEADRRKKEEEERQRALAAAPPAPQLEAPAPEALESTTAALESNPTEVQPGATVPEAPAPEPTPIAADSPNPYETNDSGMAAPDVAAGATRMVAAEPTAEAVIGSPQAGETALLPFEEPASSIGVKGDTLSGPEPAPASTVEPPTLEPTAPRILPPSTGETVAAEPPRKRKRRKPAATPPADTGKAPESATPEAERSEPATHHG